MTATLADVYEQLTAVRNNSRKWERRAKDNLAKLETLRAEMDTLRADGQPTPATAAMEAIGAHVRRLERENRHLRRALAETLRPESRPRRAVTAHTVKETR